MKNLGAPARDCGGGPLQYDHACLEIVSHKDVEFYMQYAGCEGCKLLPKANVTANKVHQIALSSLWPVQWKLYDYESGANVCNESVAYVGEYGHYALNSTECGVRMTLEPDAAYLPLLELAVTLLGLATLWYVVKAALVRIRTTQAYSAFFHREDDELGDIRPLVVEPIPRSRLKSLDVFRGAAIALMIFVNCGGGGYSLFKHATWNGMTIADVVFPCFAWIMGASLVLSLNARLLVGVTRSSALYQVARRSLVMFVMGAVLGSRDAGWTDVRVPGVLQRLAACYWLVGSLECLCMSNSNSIVSGRSLIRDLSAGWKQWTFTIILVTIQVCVSMLVAAPGCPVGYAGPGGLHMSARGLNLTNCTGGIAAHIDKTLLGAGHLYRGGSFRSLYHASAPFDPEGILGTLTAALVTQAGAHSSRIMLSYNHARARVMRLVGWSLLLSLTGGALCGFTQDGGPIPINKSLWSLSYCLVTSGIAFFVQAVLYFCVDLKAKWGGRPLYYAGHNALTLYVISELLRRHFPLRWPMVAATHAQLLASHAATTLFMLAIGVALYKKRVFISI